MKKEHTLSFKLNGFELDRLLLGMRLSIDIMQSMSSNASIADIIKQLQIIKHFSLHRATISGALNKMLLQISGHDYYLVNPSGMKYFILSEDNFKVITRRKLIYSMFDSLEEITLKEAEEKFKISFDLDSVESDKLSEDILDATLPEPSIQDLQNKIIELSGKVVSLLDTDNDLKTMQERLNVLFLKPEITNDSVLEIEEANQEREILSEKELADKKEDEELQRIIKSFEDPVDGAVSFDENASDDVKVLESVQSMY